MTDTSKTPTRGLDKAFDTMKHITTLCTGLIGLTVTFADKFKAKDTDLTVAASMQWAWGLYILALAACLWSLLAITGSLNALDKGEGGNDAMSSNIRIPALLGLFAFGVAVLLTVIAGSSIAA